MFNQVFFLFTEYEPPEWASENGNFIDCSQGRTDPDTDKVCEFKLDYIRPCVYEDDYGWFEGQPCIILKLNRVSFFTKQSLSIHWCLSHWVDALQGQT